jgi:4-amino-4-deoxy-L-arabinose transferase-like glycosyltransferase
MNEGKNQETLSHTELGILWRLALTLNSSWKRYWWLAILAFIVVAGMAIYFYMCPPRSQEPLWDAAERLVLVLTLFVAFAVWLSEQRREWESQLPRRLTVTFHFAGDPEIKMECRDAYLAHEADIRNWGQQIGRQMTGTNEWLDFDPDIKQEPGVIVRENKEIFILYKAVFKLTKPPEVFEKRPDLRQIIWSYNFIERHMDKNAEP